MQVAGQSGERTFAVGSDVGGTFTDVVVLDPVSRRIRIEKVPTTPEDPSTAVLDGLRRLGEIQPEALEHTRRFIHATTLVANTVVERSGSRTALLVTEGFRDILRLRRHNRISTFDLYLDPPEPLVPRSLTFAVRERLLASGKVLVALDHDQIRAIGRSLVDAGVESIAVVLLHSYVNPVHEELTAEILGEVAPELRVTLSSRVLRHYMEYERASTTVVSAYVSNRLGEYLGNLERASATLGLSAPLYVMTSSGGVSPVPAVVDAPVRLVESGPAAGATFAATLARRQARPAILSFDMGGTTAKGCFIRDGELPLAEQIEVARAQSFRPGTGLPLRVPTVDLIEIGAGGGSIAARDSVGLMRVGPQSAGAIPGPACYARDGTAPTVTDADLVLGHLAADRFLGGSMVLSLERAVEALASLSDSGDAMAVGRLVHHVITDNMAAAITQHLLERGGDPAHTTLVAFGGAGPVHADALARRLGMTTFLVPPFSGVMSAVGLLAAPPSFQLTRMVKIPIDRLQSGDLRQPIREMQEEIAAILAPVEAAGPIRFRIFASCAYVGQSSALPLAIADADVTGAELVALFVKTYRQTYGAAYDDVAVEVSSILVNGELALDVGMDDAVQRDDSPRPPDRRSAWSIAADALVEFTVCHRSALRPGDRLQGPLIVEERESTTVVDLDAVLAVDEHHNLVVTLR